LWRLVPPLDRFSEPFPPHGALAAEGAENLLGRPRLDPLTVLVREAVQNSWDARRPDAACVGFAVRGTSLTATQIGVLRDEVFADAPPAAARLREVVERGDVLLLSLTDTGTTGLGGPVRADRPAARGEPTDFVDLLFNIGQPNDRTFGGGSYGFGKTISYVVSEARAVVIATRTEHAGGPESRFMSAAFSDHYAKGAQRYTGRHWWGRWADDSIEPVTGAAADELAARIGLEPFAADDRGTTIAVVAPDLRGRSPVQAMRYVADALTWNFWPKMLAAPDHDGPSMRFTVELDGEPIDVPAPDELPPLAAYADALRAVRAAERSGTPGDDDRLIVRELRAGQPSRRLGWLGIVRAPVVPRVGRDVGVDEVGGLGPADAFDGLSHHVGLLRQPELVVEYLEGPELPLLDTEWAAVFKADAELDAAFAAAEPPTHDRWEPSLVAAGPARRSVLSALLELRDAAASFAVPPADPLDDGRLSAVLVAEALGGLLEHDPTDEPIIPPEPPDAVVFTSVSLAAAATAGRRVSEVGFAVDPMLRREPRVLDASALVVAGPDGRASAGASARRGDAVVVGFTDLDERWSVEGTALGLDEAGPRRWWLTVDSPTDAAVAVELASRPAGRFASRLVVLPHWAASSVLAGPWKITVHGVDHPAGGRLAGWDYETPLEIATTVRVDLERVRRECALVPTDELAVVGTWLATGTNTRRCGAVVPVTSSGDHRLHFAVDPGEVGGRLRLERRLVLVGAGAGDDPFAARAPGSVLWSDAPIVTLLEVDVARFPTEAVEFAGPPVAIPGAAWWLDASFDDLDASPHHALRLFVNAEHPAVTPVLSGSTDEVAASVRSVLRWQVVRSLVVGALASGDFVDRASGAGAGFDAGTLGASLLRLVTRHFPGESLTALRRSARDDPHRFDARLQAAVDLWEEAVR
jgi:hypothetical protein